MFVEKTTNYGMMRDKKFISFVEVEDEEDGEEGEVR